MSEDMRAFLDYLSGKQVDNDFVNRIDKEVSRAQTREEWRLEYMTLSLRDREKHEEGRIEGQVLQLYKWMKKGRLTFEEAYEEVQEILTPEEFQEKLEELSNSSVSSRK